MRGVSEPSGDCEIVETRTHLFNVNLTRLVLTQQLLGRTVHKGSHDLLVPLRMHDCDSTAFSMRNIPKGYSLQR